VPSPADIQLLALDVDGVLGPATLRHFNTPAEFRLAQVDANMERRRWLPRSLPQDRLEIDTGAATGALYRGGRIVHAFRVIPGSVKDPTPIFASSLNTIVLNPPWNVPDRIAREEILPKAARDPGYLARNGYVRIGGRLQQPPGPKAALGLVKFDLVSPFGVYLHDTPGRDAFRRWPTRPSGTGPVSSGLVMLHFLAGMAGRQRGKWIAPPAGRCGSYPRPGFELQRSSSGPFQWHRRVLYRNLLRQKKD
jgi:murein L,D-transpeptidase YcbB/YkuD